VVIAQLKASGYDHLVNEHYKDQFASAVPTARETRQQGMQAANRIDLKQLTFTNAA
jgi:hypothetical protein